MKVPFFKLSSVDEEIQLVNEVLKSGWLTTASKTTEFEAKFREFCKVEHALAVNSCTAGLHLSLEALGVKKDSKVIVPSLTFTASAEVVRYLDAEPVIVDVDKETGLITKELIAKAVAEHGKIDAVIVVHYAGQSAEMTGLDGICDYCTKQEIKVLVDAAHAFPAFDQYGPVGSVGDVTCFSFYANKTITTGEGGMVVTNDSSLAKRIKVMRLHGIDRDVWDRFTKKGASWEYDVVAPGYKYNMPDVNAAIGLAQFKKAEIFRQQRQDIAEYYIGALQTEPSVKMFKSRVPHHQHAWHLFPILIEAGHDRNLLIEELAKRNVGVSVHYKPIHRLSYYKNTYGLQPERFPNTEAIWKSCLSLPIYPEMTVSQAEYVISSLKNSLEVL
ncbi:DegT/DnrJ/EryC1/StrS family aminotransferase [Planctobacterium marinum]|uniref:Spore coat protein n=1 Tax=Planctobacterium marinum TaxID=1631968 RepID=A0AA48HTF8_9ALTE|nr:spore coat protein [Planctobacterium marinum]